MNKEKLNILYIIGSLDSGGAERQVVELARALNKNRFNVYIIIYHNKIHYKEILETEGVFLQIIEKRFKLDPSFPFRLANFIKRYDIDIIHAYSESAGFWSRIAGKLTGRKTITHIQNTHYSRNFFLLERLMGWMDARIIANSFAGKEEYLANIRGRNIDVIQNGLNFELIPKQSPTLVKPQNKQLCPHSDCFDNIPSSAICKLNGCHPKDGSSGNGIEALPFATDSTSEKIVSTANSSSLHIISVGRISRQKNYLCLLRAINIVREKIANLQVEIWGRIMNHRIYEEMIDFINKNQLQNIVHYRGTSPEIINKIANSDLLVLTSLWEGFPNVVMEALACGTPVIASDVADIKYLVKDGENGFLFPSDRHDILAEKIVAYANLDPTTRKKMGESGRKLIEDNYTIEIMSRKTEEIYEKIVGMK